MGPAVLLQYRLTGRLSAGTLRAELDALLGRVGEQLACRSYLLP